MNSELSAIFESLYRDVMLGSTIICGTKQSGKSHLKKCLCDYVMSEHPTTKLIIVDTEGSWEWEFNKIPFYRIVNGDVSITQEIIGQKLNGNNFYRTVYKIKELVRNDIEKLLKNKDPILFIVELSDPEEIGYFSAYITERIYQMQRIKRKYWKNNLKDSYFIAYEELENIFGTYVLDKKILGSYLKKFNEMANLNIGVLGSAQRATEISTKFRNKASSFCFGYVLPTDFIGILERALRLHMGKEAKQITSPEFRHKFYYTGLNKVFKCDQFQQEGTPFEIPRTEPQTEETTQTEETIKLKRQVKKPTLAQRLKHLWRRFVSFPIPVNDKPTNQITYTEDEPEDLNKLLADNNEELNELLYMDEAD